MRTKNHIPSALHHTCSAGDCREADQRREAGLSWLWTIFALAILLASPAIALAQAGRNVTLVIHEGEALADNDNNGIADAGGGKHELYFEAEFKFQDDSDPVLIKSEIYDYVSNTTEADNFPDGGVMFTVPDVSDDPIEITIQMWDDDISGDDEFDLVENSEETELRITFDPKTQTITQSNASGFATPVCGQLSTCGIADCPPQDSGDFGRIKISVQTSAAWDADTDDDDLLDSWEACGVDRDGDGTIDLDLPAWGADPFRKDLFLELDWMVDNDSAGTPDHSHEPALPALIQMWSEFAMAPVTNPPNPAAGVPPSKDGIALHIDVGTLYNGYTLDLDGDGSDEYDLSLNKDIDGDGTPEFVALGGGNIDLGTPSNFSNSASLQGPDGVLDIGDLGGGQQLSEDETLTQPEATALTSANFDRAREDIFYYGIMGHRLDEDWPLGRDCSDAAAPTPNSNCCMTSGIALTGEGENFFLVTMADATDSCTNGWTNDLRLNRDGIQPSGPLTGATGLSIQPGPGPQSGTLMHEFGHLLGLGHGSCDSVNNKPHHLSVMNYSFQFGIAFDAGIDNAFDALPSGYDLDMDGQDDVVRYPYSFDAVSDTTEETLNETALDENDGIGTPATISTYQPLTLFGAETSTCNGLPFLGSGTNCRIVATTGGAISWTNAPPISASVSVNINDDELPLPPLGPFPLFSSLDRAPEWPVVPGGFDPDIPNACDAGSDGLDYQEWNETRKRTVRAVSLGQPHARCGYQVEIEFDDLPVGSFNADHYAPRVRWDLPDGAGLAVTSHGDARGLPTDTMPNSLVQNVSVMGAPMSIHLNPAVTSVGLAVGLIEDQPSAGSFSLAAFDEDGDMMGQEVIDVGPTASGIVHFIGLQSALPFEAISEIRLESSFDAPLQIDSLTACSGRAASSGEIDHGDLPDWGDTITQVDIQATALTYVETDLGYGPTVSAQRSELGGGQVIIDGESTALPAQVERKRSDVIELEVPPTLVHEGATHQIAYWEVNGQVIMAPGSTVLRIPVMKLLKIRPLYHGYKESSFDNLCMPQLNLGACRLTPPVAGGKRAGRFAIKCVDSDIPGGLEGNYAEGDEVEISICDADGHCARQALGDAECIASDHRLKCKSPRKQSPVVQVGLTQRKKTRTPDLYKFIGKAKDMDLDELRPAATPWTVGLRIGKRCGYADCPVGSRKSICKKPAPIRIRPLAGR